MLTSDQVLQAHGKIVEARKAFEDGANITWLKDYVWECLQGWAGSKTIRDVRILIDNDGRIYGAEARDACGQEVYLGDNKDIERNVIRPLQRFCAVLQDAFGRHPHIFFVQEPESPPGEEDIRGHHVKLLLDDNQAGGVVAVLYFYDEPTDKEYMEGPKAVAVYDRKSRSERLRIAQQRLYDLARMRRRLATTYGDYRLTFALEKGEHIARLVRERELGSYIFPKVVREVTLKVPPRWFWQGQEAQSVMELAAQAVKDLLAPLHELASLNGTDRSFKPSRK